jgi:DMSO/TMAO reductase YedYZ molybdopterin-dependent catalytic subunit
VKRSPDRRAFLRAAGLGAAGLVAGCGWRGGRFEIVLRWWDQPNEFLQKAITPTRPRARILPSGSETPEDAFPQYYQSAMIPRVDVRTWRLEVGGLVRRPLTISLADLERMPRTTLRLRHYCIEGWTAVASWTGVRLAELARIVGADPEAEYVDFRSFDVGYWSSWDRESALHPQSLIAYGMNGHYLTPGHGAPARLYSNLKYGYKSVKYLTAIRFMRERTGGFWEDRGYDWYAGL